MSWTGRGADVGSPTGEDDGKQGGREVAVAEAEQTWIARVTPAAGGSVPGLLRLPLGLDVWARHAEFLVVAAPESRLAELERRRLAHVDRLMTQPQYVARQRRREGGPPPVVDEP